VDTAIARPLQSRRYFRMAYDSDNQDSKEILIVSMACAVSQDQSSCGAKVSLLHDNGNARREALAHSNLPIERPSFFSCIRSVTMIDSPKSSYTLSRGHVLERRSPFRNIFKGILAACRDTRS
jgi:hypothetical protein